jgi:5'-nucleotidase
MNRKQFLTSAAFTAGWMVVNPMGLSAEVLRKRGWRKITVLHTNDTHSQIDPFPANDPNYPGQGGFARRAALVDMIRKDETNVLLLDAGDIFQGTPYFNFYGGELEFKLMSRLKYDAATLGNHDFDNGIEGLVKQLPHASFPFVNANYDFSNTLLKDKIKPYVIKEMEGIKVGIFGVGIELAGLVDPKLYGEIQYTDPISCANTIAARLKHDYRCHLIICLSHLGYQYATNKVSDRVLAVETKNIHLIIGGHTHTFLEHPVEILNGDRKKIWINQVGWGGLYLGRMDFIFGDSERDFYTSNFLYKIFKKTI